MQQRQRGGPEQQQQAWVAAFPFVLSAVNHAMSCTELREMCYEDAAQAARGVYRSRLRRPPPRGELPEGAAVIFDVNHLVLTLLVARDPIAHGADEALRGIIGAQQQHSGGEAADWTSVAQAFIAWFSAQAPPPGGKVVWVQGTTAAGAWRFAAARRVGFPSRRAWAVFLLCKRTWANLSGMPAFSEAELLTAPPARRRPPRAPAPPAAAPAAAVSAAAAAPASDRWADWVDED
jgi:hypothetical protein